MLDLNEIFIFISEPEGPEVGYNNDSCKLHDAGYDAYVTSCVFVNLCNLLGKLLYLASLTYIFLFYLFELLFEIWSKAN